MNSKINSKFILYLIIIFIVVQVIGLATANYYSSQDIRISIVTDNPDDIINAVAIIVEILFITGLMLVLRKLFKKRGYLHIFEFLALLIGMIIVFDIFLPYISALFISFLVLYIRHILKENPNYQKTLLWYNNVLLGLAIAGAGAIIGLSLGLIPVIVFLILLSIYDFIAVFYTKHMVTLAKMFIKQKLALTFAIPSKKRTFQLGGGDIVIPLTVSASFFFVLIKSYSFWIAILPIIGIWIASLLGLFWTFWFITNNKRGIKVMPALPPQAILMLIVIIITYILLL